MCAHSRTHTHTHMHALVNVQTKCTCSHCNMLRTHKKRKLHRWTAAAHAHVNNCVHVALAEEGTCLSRVHMQRAHTCTYTHIHAHPRMRSQDALAEVGTRLDGLEGRQPRLGAGIGSKSIRPADLKDMELHLLDRLEEQVQWAAFGGFAWCYTQAAGPGALGSAWRECAVLLTGRKARCWAHDVELHLLDRCVYLLVQVCVQ